MKSRLQRSTTALLVAMVGMSLVFGAGCAGTKKKKAQEVTELPDKDKSETSTEGEQHSDAGKDSSGSGTSDIAGGGSGSPSDSFASNPPPKDDLTPAPAGGGAGGFEGLESRHGAASIGAEENLALAPAEKPTIAEEEPAAAPAPKKKKKKKKKASLEAPVETADADAGVSGDDTGATDGANSYTVKKGDSLSKIAKSHGVKLKALLTANGMKMEDAAKLKVGAKLKIPAGKAG
jgi:LysM repeat protein